MKDFVSLESTLEGHFDKTFAELPDEVLQHVGMRPPPAGKRGTRAFVLIPWDSLSPDHRRQVAHQWDCENDPTSEQERERAWDLLVKCDDLEQEIAEWNLLPARLPSERLTKETRIAELRQQLASAKHELEVEDPARQENETQAGNAGPLSAPDVRRRPVTRNVETWLDARIATWPEDKPFPTESEDHQAAVATLGAVRRKQIRDARGRATVPPNWRKRGPRQLGG